MNPRFLVLLVLSALVVRADLVDCENGDRYTGTVLLVNDKEVKLQNEITGLLTIPRDKVVSIVFKEKAAAIAKAPLKPATPQKQQAESAIAQVQQQFLADATPEAQQMFQSMVNDLMSGKMDLGALSREAQSTLKELRDLQKELGDDAGGEILNSYAAILENFVKNVPARTNAGAAPKLKTEDLSE